MVSDGREGPKEEEDGGVEISAEQKTRSRPYFHFPPALGRLPCPLGAGDEPIALGGREEKRWIPVL